jgi:hypothetical protein
LLGIFWQAGLIWHPILNLAEAGMSQDSSAGDRRAGGSLNPNSKIKLCWQWFLIRVPNQVFARL